MTEICVFAGRAGNLIAIKREAIEAVVQDDLGAIVVTANDTYTTAVEFHEAMRTAFLWDGREPE